MRPRLALLGGFVALSVIGGGLGYRWITTVTQVSTNEAVRRFHEGNRSASPRTSSQSPEPRTTRPAGRDRSAIAPNETPQLDAAPKSSTSMSPFAPEVGVYTWRTEGFEEAMGIRRSFPPESHRIVGGDGSRNFTYEHIYSEEHREWFGVQASDSGAAVPHIRTRVVFGPFDGEVDVNFAPPMLLIRTPFALGDHWEGRWSGDTYGMYTARTFERTMITVGNTRVEAWGIEVVIQMHGEVESEQRLKAWVAPEERTTVREEYVVTGRFSGEPGTYHGEWSIALTSLHPKR